MYFFFIISSIYIGWLLSLLPSLYRDNDSFLGLSDIIEEEEREIEAQRDLEREIENEFEFLTKEKLD